MSTSDGLPTGSATTETTMDGIARIAAERKRQTEVEGWTTEHDAEHVDGSLATAASIYAMPPRNRLIRGDGGAPLGWPWAYSWWKPTPKDRVRELEKAGALIAAEIDRILRERADV